MGGTRKGAYKGTITKLNRYGVDFFAEIGAKGGKASNKGGFYNNPEVAREMGRIGGRISKNDMTYLGTKGNKRLYLSKKTQTIVEYPIDDK